jgi:hypothetical protein
LPAFLIEPAAAIYCSGIEDLLNILLVKAEVIEPGVFNVWV